MNDMDFHLQKIKSSDSGEEDEACLLYTSDAADDMQCVDLGGRRTVKKPGRGT